MTKDNLCHIDQTPGGVTLCGVEFTGKEPGNRFGRIEAGLRQHEFGRCRMCGKKACSVCDEAAKVMLAHEREVELSKIAD